MNDAHNKVYWDGTKNRCVRYYWYAQKGLALLNEARYLVMVIGGLYFILKLTNPLWMVGMFLVCIPALIFLGWLQTHHMATIMDWLGTRYSSYWGRRSFDLQERQVAALEQILKELKEK